MLSHRETQERFPGLKVGEVTLTERALGKYLGVSKTHAPFFGSSDCQKTFQFIVDKAAQAAIPIPAGA